MVFVKQVKMIEGSTVHTVCAEMTGEFLEYTKYQGNDLSTPHRYFPGLKIGDKWCICAARWENINEIPQ